MANNTNNNAVCGLCDLPCNDKDEMKFGVDYYVEGLCEFIKECQTPLSIALQGEWGTGKTSFINVIKKNLEKDDFITIYFNTWQYSQFNMAESLYFSFITNILQMLGEKSDMRDMVQEIAKNLEKVCVNIFKQGIEKITGFNVEKITDSIKQKYDCIKFVNDFKSQFQNIITKVAETSGKNKVIIFVDDLDRLNPEIAVELLEVIKLFMDVKNCNFILAVDYDVVVNGVKKKYDTGMKDEKCRSFFDKIIQVPFAMPVAKYDIRGMFEETFKDYLKDEHLELVFEILTKAIGTNPRSFKRLTNLFILLEKINKKQNKNTIIESDKIYRYNALLLISLAIQLNLPEMYDEMLKCDNYSTLKQYIGNDALNIDSNIHNLQIALRQALNGISENAGRECNVYEEFYGILKLASSVSTSSAKLQAVEKITKISINHKEYKVANATEAFIKTYNILLNNNKDKLTDGLMQQQINILTYDAEASKSIFRAKKKLDITCNGKEIFLGTSSGTPVKMTQANKLCQYLELPAGYLVWYNEENVVFENSGGDY